MARVILNPLPATIKHRVLVESQDNGETTPIRHRQILDPSVHQVKKANKKSRKRGVGGVRPKPVEQKLNREFVGIGPGQLVTVRGYRDTKWVVIEEPSAKLSNPLTGEKTEIQCHTRRVGKVAVSVTLMGPDGIQICVPIGWVKPFLG